MKSALKFFAIAFLLQMPILYLGCSEQITETAYERELKNSLFYLKVTDQGGAPINGLAVGYVPNATFNKWNSDISYSYYQKGTVIRFNVVDSAIINLGIYNQLDGHLVQQALSNQLFAPGYYYVFYKNSSGDENLRVLKYHLTAKDQKNNNILFEETSTMTHSDLIIKSVPLGCTSTDGVFATNDTTLFPNLIFSNDNPLYVTNTNTPDVIGTYTLPDTLHFYISNSTNEKMMFMDWDMKKINNRHEVIWQPRDVNLFGFVRPWNITKNQSVQVFDNVTFWYMSLGGDLEAILNFGWGTTKEVNMDFYVVERSYDGVEWTAVDTVKASLGNDSSKFYEYKILNVQSGDINFRLKMVDKAGNYGYSLSMKTNTPKPTYWKLWQNYPNPCNF